MNNVDVFEVLSALEDLLDLRVNNSARVDIWVIQDFINNQRSIYSGGQGECAA